VSDDPEGGEGGGGDRDGWWTVDRARTGMHRIWAYSDFFSEDATMRTTTMGID